ncbi:hypothetical protein SADUNF_Sadunf14G0043700 [Salix dunnii]|uniref:Uncharacterized protein n=1 Tax=Salix dunnii TaxID=1413687 RepID=A0A835MPQ0_9ROSI|nr:hypothetical protein SADUNF_Sadunf14G0043700 [Salix dunnii]
MKSTSKKITKERRHPFHDDDLITIQFGFGGLRVLTTIKEECVSDLCSKIVYTYLPENPTEEALGSPPLWQQVRGTTQPQVGSSMASLSEGGHWIGTYQDSSLPKLHLERENEALRSELMKMNLYVSDMQKNQGSSANGIAAAAPTTTGSRKHTFFSSMSKTLGKLNPFKHGSKDTLHIDDNIGILPSQGGEGSPYLRS